MKGYHNTVSTLAGVRQEAEVPLVVNLFQSVLDGFIRGELKRMESDPTKVDFRLSVKSLDHFNSNNLTHSSPFLLLSGYEDGEQEEKQ